MEYVIEKWIVIYVNYDIYKGVHDVHVEFRDWRVEKTAMMLCNFYIMDTIMYM